MSPPQSAVDAGPANAQLHHSTWAERIDTLPRFLTRFVGRERQLTDVSGLLRNPHVRLLTLVGPGGVGKTRLAVAAADLVDSAYRDGTLFVPLGSVVDPGLVIPSIAAALKVEDGEGPVELRVRWWLAGRQVLMVLDNFEQVVSAGPAVASLLKSSPGVTAMVTSRSPLRVSGEQVYQVTPLELPNTSRALTPADVLDSEAGALFVQSARATWPGFTLTADNTPAVLEICRRLDGLPLALELAASRVNVLPADELLARLGNQLQVLTAGPHDVPERQRTMRATIAWSYGLLAPEHQALFRWLAVFRGGFSLEVAEKVLASGSQSDQGDRLSGDQVLPSDAVADFHFDLLEGVGALVEQNLIARDARYQSDSRFRMLEPIRAFGLEQLMARAEEPAIYARFNAYWQARAEASWAAGDSLDSLTHALEELEREHDNLRAALDWLELHDVNTALALAEGLFWFWYVRGHRAEGLQRLDRYLGAALDRRPNRTLARALVAAAVLSHFQNQSEKAERLAQEALADWRELGDPLGIGFALFALGVIAEDTGSYERANLLLREALALMEAEGNRGFAGSLRFHLAVVAFARGDLEESQSILSSLLEGSDLPQLRVTPWAVHLQGLVADAMGDTSFALEILQESLRQFLNAHATSEIAQGLSGVAVAASHWNQEAATQLFAAATRLNEDRGEKFPLPELSVYEQATDRLRSSLGEERFNAEYATGRDWSMAQAIEHALAIQPPVIVESPGLPRGLSEREAEILRLLAAGMTNDGIAGELYLSPRTVQTHLTNIYRKIDVSRRSEAVRFAIDHRLA